MTVQPDIGCPEHASRTRDVMLRHPKTMSAQASIEETRAALANDHVHMVLLIDGTELVGTVVRADLPGVGAGAGPALPWSKLDGRTVAPDGPADSLQQLLVDRGLRRLAVVDNQGALLGLVCLKRRRTGFCSDQEVASRAGSAPSPCAPWAKRSERDALGEGRHV